MTPTQRTLKALKDQGIPCDIVERYIRFYSNDPRTQKIPGFRKDAFGFIDILAIYPHQVFGIQSCGQAFAAHDQKILENEFAPQWLRAGNGIALYGWRKLKLKRGGKAMRWMPRIKIFTLDDF